MNGMMGDDRLQLEEKKFCGTAKTPEGEQGVIGFLEVTRGNREMSITKIEDGSFLIYAETRFEDQEPVIAKSRFSETTLLMFTELILDGIRYFGCDVDKYADEMSNVKERKSRYGGEGNKFWLEGEQDHE